MNDKVAVVLANIGGPGCLYCVKPYLYNFFYDYYITRLPKLPRIVLAWMISRFRCSKTTEIYKMLGGKSPLLKNAQEQGSVLENALNSEERTHYKVYICMRYWHPKASNVVEEIKKDGFTDKVVFLPMYPQYCTATTESAIKDWQIFADFRNTYFVEPHYKNRNYTAANVRLILEECAKAEKFGQFKIIFSAHSIPQSFVNSGDPYQKQILETVELIMAGVEKIYTNQNYIVAYQSKVGFKKWLGPSTYNVLVECAKAGVIPVVVPISFVCENSETLYELDIEYKNELEKLGMKNFFRVPTVSTCEEYIRCLVELVKNVS